MSALQAFCSGQRQSDADSRAESAELSRQSMERDLHFRLQREEREERQEYADHFAARVDAFTDCRAD